MSNSQGAPDFRNLQSSGAHHLLHPKCPLPTASTSYSNVVDPKGNSRSEEGLRMHHRTASESFLPEEQPSWLDDLLNEPKTPVNREAHRRSSSDSLPYLNTSSISWSAGSLAHDNHKHGTSTARSTWGPKEFEFLKDKQCTSYYMDVNSFGGSQSRGSESKMNKNAHPNSSLQCTNDKLLLLGSLSTTKKPHASSSTEMESQVQDEYGHDPMGSFEKREGSQAKHHQSEMETKRAKQQFAQRSRVRKLQYIADLERNVKALQNLIMSLENKSMKQRLDCLVHEHLVKCLQHEMLGQEASRLRSLYRYQQQQQQKQHPPPIHTRSKSRDLDSQFANLSLKGNELNSGPGQLQI